MLADIVKFSKKLTLWRLDKVIRKWLKFREIGQDPNKNTNIRQYLIQNNSKN